MFRNHILIYIYIYIYDIYIWHINVFGGCFRLVHVVKTASKTIEKTKPNQTKPNKTTAQYQLAGIYIKEQTEYIVKVR